MDVMAIGLGIFVAGGIIVVLARPWWQKDTTGIEVDSVAALSARYETLLMALRDLDFDYTVGKVTPADYGPMRQALLGEIAAVMAQQEEQQAAETARRIKAKAPAIGRTFRAEPPPLTGNPCSTCGQISRTGDLYCRRCGSPLKTACPKCGASVNPADHFCTACGIELAMAISG